MAKKMLVLFLFSLSAWANPLTQALPSRSVENFDSCNWLVNYRGNTYDLAPLTKEGLNRPVEGDLRLVLERVPESEKYLQQISRATSNAKAHTIIASAALSSLLLSRVFRAGQKNTEKHLAFDIWGIVSAGIFLKGTHESWRSSQEAKESLVNAIDTFNEVSPHKIVPANPDNLEATR